MNHLDKKSWLRLLWPALLILFITALPRQAAARPPQAITLLYFEGTGQDNAILLEWATATEFETAGFVIQRADSEGGPYVEQIGFMAAEGGGIIGAQYEALDDVNVVNGQSYWYILVEIENDGTQNPTDPISVTGGLATPTATATQEPPSQPTTPSQPTATPTGTPTQTPTTQPTTQPTSQSQSNTGAAPTNTSAPPPSQSGYPGPPTAAPPANSQPGGSGPTNVVQASSPTDPYPGPIGTASPTFVPDPNQTIESEGSPYPGPGETGEAAPGEGYPGPTQSTGDEPLVETPVIQPQSTPGARELSTQPPLEQQSSEESEPARSNTLFLWIGFTAAFLIFLGGVIGSIFLFTRRSNQR